MDSIVGATNETGVVTGYRIYEAFGNTTLSSGTIPIYGYAGGEPDATALAHMGALYHDADVGRFRQPDPLGAHSESDTQHSFPRHFICPQLTGAVREQCVSSAHK